MWFFDWLFSAFEKVVGGVSRPMAAPSMSRQTEARRQSAEQSFRQYAAARTTDQKERHQIQMVKQWRDHGYQGEVNYYLGKNKEGYHWAVEFPHNQEQPLDWHGPYKQETEAVKHLDRMEEKWNRSEERHEGRLISEFERQEDKVHQQAIKIVWNADRDR